MTPSSNLRLLFPPIRRRSPRYAWATIRSQPLLLLALIGSKAGMVTEDVLALCKIDSREFAVLDFLSRARTPLPQATIAHALRRDRTSAMRITRSLSEKGLVSPLTDPEDGRVHSLQLTPRGREQNDVAKDNMLVAAEDLLEILSDEERMWLLTHLVRILEARG